MELKIGFKNKYWTLWEVTSSATPECNGQIRTHFQYVQNLSTNYMKAMESAILKGTTDLDVYEILRDRSRSFYIDSNKPHPILDHIELNLFNDIKSVVKSLFKKITA